MKKILVFSPNEGDGCSFYRGIGVLGELRRHNILVERASIGKISWATFSDVDVVFMQRPYTEQHLQIAKLAKQQCALWVDYDDLLTHVPDNNPHQKDYVNVEATIQELVQLTDCCTFSTDELLKNMPQGKTNLVIPNAYNDYRLPVEYDPRQSESKRLRVLWRGTSSHIGDLLAFEYQLEQLVNAYIGYDFFFFGYKPWMIESVHGNMYHVPTQPLFTYQQTIEAIRPDILIVPLEDTLFNRCKSNIAWLEVARHGTKCIVPEWDEWQKPNCLGYEVPYDLFAKFSEADFYLGRDNAAWNYVQDNLFLSDVNKKRLEIINGL